MLTKTRFLSFVILYLVAIRLVGPAIEFYARTSGKPATHEVIVTGFRIYYALFAGFLVLWILVTLIGRPKARQDVTAPYMPTPVVAPTSMAYNPFSPGTFIFKSLFPMAVVVLALLMAMVMVLVLTGRM